MSDIDAELRFDPTLYPNVVAIKTLSVEALQTFTDYLSDYAYASQYAIRTALNMSTKDMSVYGIYNNTVSGKVAYNATWSKPDAVSNNGSPQTQVLSTVAGWVGKVGSLGKSVETFTGAASKLASGNTSLNAYAGVRNLDTTIGNKTRREFGGYSTDYAGSVNIKYYMPQQYEQATMAIQTLLKMARPQSLAPTDVKQTVVNTIGESFDKLITQSTVGLVNAGDNLAGVVDGATGQADLNKIMTTWSQNTLNYVSELAKYTKEFGLEYYLDPLPVSIQLGHTSFLVPMVLTKVDITMSDERYYRYVSNDTRSYHAATPLSVTVAISYEPLFTSITPRLDKSSILFGQVKMGEEPTAAYAHQSKINIERYTRDVDPTQPSPAKAGK